MKRKITTIDESAPPKFCTDEKAILFFCLHTQIVVAVTQLPEVDAYIETFTKENNFNGTILIENNENTLCKKASDLQIFPLKYLIQLTQNIE